MGEQAEIPPSLSDGLWGWEKHAEPGRLLRAHTPGHVVKLEDVQMQRRGADRPGFKVSAPVTTANPSALGASFPPSIKWGGLESVS